MLLVTNSMSGTTPVDGLVGAFMSKCIPRAEPLQASDTAWVEALEQALYAENLPHSMPVNNMCIVHSIGNTVASITAFHIESQCGHNTMLYVQKW